MNLFDLTTWVSVVILIGGSLAVFVWFLMDAGKVLRGSGTPPPDDPSHRGDGSEESFRE
jgi:hypothetical protein